MLAIILEQFKNLFDPSTALGAFLISFAAGILCSFIGGWKACQHRYNKNKIEANDVRGNIVQHSTARDSDSSKVSSIEKGKNSIKVHNAQGDIKQDVRE